MFCIWWNLFWKIKNPVEGEKKKKKKKGRAYCWQIFFHFDCFRDKWNHYCFILVQFHFTLLKITLNKLLWQFCTAIYMPRHWRKVLWLYFTVLREQRLHLYESTVISFSCFTKYDFFCFLSFVGCYMCFTKKIIFHFFHLFHFFHNPVQWR